MADENMTREDFDSQVQMLVERLYEDEALRGDLTDDESGPLLEWAYQDLTARLEQAFTANPQAANMNKALENEYRRTRNLVIAIKELVNGGSGGQGLTTMNRSPLDPAGINARELMALRNQFKGKERPQRIAMTVEALKKNKPAG